MHKILVTVIVAGALNFATCLLGNFMLQGDAVSARSSCPHGDYVANHRICHPVSHAAYVYSEVHNYSAIASAPFWFIASLILAYRKAAVAADGPHRR